MLLTAKEIAKMIDLSCVRTISNKSDIYEMVNAAQKYGFGQVSVLQCFIPYTKQLLSSTPGIRIVGNVSFPTGSDSTNIKVAQANEMVASGCDEIDVVMNIGKLRSGELSEVESDLRAVIEVANPLPVKVIIEIMYLTYEEIKQACDLCLAVGADYIKTGTGWADRGTTPQDVQLIKSLVGNRINIKASGGIRSLEMLTELYQAGARRFGVNLRSGVEIVEKCLSLENGNEIRV
jgi:deoxyribose-phosphate aldolase